jgi:hypothetical protein
MNLRTKLKLRMDELQRCMENNDHLTQRDYVEEVIDKVNYAFHVLSEEDREYIQMAQVAVEEQLEWGSPDSWPENNEQT